jgi:hypothetical protein
VENLHKESIKDIRLINEILPDSQLQLDVASFHREVRPACANIMMLPFSCGNHWRNSHATSIFRQYKAAYLTGKRLNPSHYSMAALVTFSCLGAICHTLVFPLNARHGYFILHKKAVAQQ